MKYQLLTLAILATSIHGKVFGDAAEDYRALADEAVRPSKLIIVEGEMRLTAQSAKQLKYLEDCRKIAIVITSDRYVQKVVLVDAGKSVQEAFDIAVVEAGMRKLDMGDGYYRVDGNPNALLTVFSAHMIICRKPFPATFDPEVEAEHDAAMNFRMKPGDVFQLGM
jgi:hypothetical protein